MLGDELPGFLIELGVDVMVLLVMMLIGKNVITILICLLQE